MFGSRDGIPRGCIDHDDPALGGCINIDIVDADAGPPDNHQFFPGLDYLSGNRRGAANN